MNNKSKPQDIEANNTIVDIYSNFIDDLYKKCGISQEQTNSEADEYDPGYNDDE